MEIKDLRRIPLLADADAALLCRFISENDAYISSYEKGATVHGEGDACEKLDVVLTGNLVAYSLTGNGSAATIFEFRENSVIGANLLFGENHAYPLNIYAVAPCTLLHLKRCAVAELLRDYSFVMKYTESLSSNSRGLNMRISMLSQKTLRENLMDYLRHLALAQGTFDIRLPISKKQLADYLGVQRPSLFREFKKMKDEGLIDIDNRSIRLLE